MDLLHWWRQGDAVTQVTALLLLAMSVASWVVILWKLRLLRRASADLPRATAAFWQAASLADAASRVQPFDRESLILPLAGAAHALAAGAPSGSLAAQGSRAQQLTRVLRDALHGVLGRLQWGQVLLATVGSTAPFVGLFGTVWGIMNAFRGLSNVGSATLAHVAPGIAEALVATAIGLFAAIPAVVAYNRFAHDIDRIAIRFESFTEEFLNILQRQLR